MMYWRIAACSMMLAALWETPVQAQGFQDDPPGWIQEKPVALPVSPLPHWYEVRDGQWQLPIETLRELALLIEAKLADNDKFNRKDRPARHAIQFRGEVPKGVPVIRLAGECDGEAGDRSSLSAQFMDIRDGNTCGFDARYTPSEKRLSYFEYHGYP